MAHVPAVPVMQCSYTDKTCSAADITYTHGRWYVGCVTAYVHVLLSLFDGLATMIQHSSMLEGPSLECMIYNLRSGLAELGSGSGDLLCRLCFFSLSFLLAFSCAVAAQPGKLKVLALKPASLRSM